MLILDTNVLSELMRPRPAPTVIEWVAGHPAGQLFITTITEAELRYGVALLPAGNRREQLGLALDQMLDEDFRQRILSFDRSAARAYAGIVARRRHAGRPISQFDAQIASIARSRDAGVATRNTLDFANCDIKLVDPWDGLTESPTD